MVSSIPREDVAARIQDEHSATVIQVAHQASTALQAFPTVNMGTKQQNIPVLATLPTGGWVNDTTNTARKPTGVMSWRKKTLVAEEIALIIAIHEHSIDDQTGDIFADAAAAAGAEIGRILDEAVFFGANKPTSWSSPDLFSAATAAGNVVSVIDGAANASDIYGAGLQVAGRLADNGFDPTTAIAKRGLAYQFANLRTGVGDLALAGDTLVGFDTYWNRNGAWDPGLASQIIVDPRMVRIGVRQDVTVKYLDQATLGTGNDQINLAEQDMIALRFKARFAYVLADPVTPETGPTSGGSTPNYGVGAVAPAAPEEP